MKKGAGGKDCNNSTCVSSCPVNWVEKEGHCYLWGGADVKKSWEDAGQFCRDEGGHLPSVTSKAINDYLKKRKGVNPIWIGGSDRKEEGVWNWLDCTAFQDQTFTAWAHRQPSNGKDQNCLELATSRWNDNVCNKQNNFVCTKRLCRPGYPDQSPEKIKRKGLLDF